MKKNEEKTNVIRILEQNKINFKVYNYINSTAISGTEVADYLGEDYNIVFKTLVTIGKSGNHYGQPDEVAVAFDLKAPTFRHKMYDGYKATRHAMPEELAQQMPVLKQLLAALGYRTVTAEGWEADDILGRFGTT